MTVGRHNTPRNALDPGAARRLYDRGLTDKQLADRCRVTVPVIVHWRRRERLHENSGLALTQLQRDAIAARAHHMTYGQWMEQKERGHG